MHCGGAMIDFGHDGVMTAPERNAARETATGAIVHHYCITGPPPSPLSLHRRPLGTAAFFFEMNPLIVRCKILLFFNLTLFVATRYGETQERAHQTELQKCGRLPR